MKAHGSGAAPGWATLVLSLLLVGGLCAVKGADNTYTIAVIPKGTTHEFWKSINAGAIKAQQELAKQGTKVEVIWKGPLREDDRDQQIQVVENFMTRRVSAIVLAPLDSQALVKPVHNAIASKVPVVIIDSDLKSDKYVSFVATDNYKGGQLAGEQMGKLLGTITRGGSWRASRWANCWVAKATLSCFGMRSVRPAPKRARRVFWRR